MIDSQASQLSVGDGDTEEQGDYHALGSGSGHSLSLPDVMSTSHGPGIGRPPGSNWQSSLHFHFNQNLSRIITSLGNFSVQYNFQAIAIALIIMSAEECTLSVADCNKGEQAGWVSASSSAVVFAGAITGQLSMGYLGDALGRDQAMTITLALASVGALLSAVLSIDSNNATMTYISIVASRFLLGIGLGGVYPLSATKAAEDGADDDAHEREGESVDSTASAKAFFWQSPGSVTPWIIAYLLTYTGMSADAKWRLLLGLGALPAAIVALLSHIETKAKLRMQKLMMIQSAEGVYDKWNPSVHSLLHPGGGGRSSGGGSSIAGGSMGRGSSSGIGGIGGGDANTSSHDSSRSNNIQIPPLSSSEHGAHDLLFGLADEPAARDREREMRNSSVGLGLSSTNAVLWENLKQWRYQKALIATGGGWFLYDVAYYGVNLFGGAILAAIDARSDDNITTDESVRRLAGQELIALGMGLPACVLTILLLKPVGTKPLQVYGFALMTAMFILLALSFDALKTSAPSSLYAIYCLLLFSLSFGPNVTTYILPAETYPKQTRSTFNGISAAMGKMGAVVGASLFKPVVKLTSYPAVMIICAIISVAGGLISLRYLDGTVACSCGDKGGSGDDGVSTPHKGGKAAAVAALSSEF